jgi:uncharacterized protein
MSDPTTNVIDDSAHHRFLYSEHGTDSELVYRAEGGRLTLVHTEVPDELGGRGIGGELVQAAVERARTSGETVVPRCPYARKWLRDHPDEVAGVTIDWSDRPG